MMGIRHRLLIAAAVCLLALIQFSSCQQIPTFTEGIFFPTRGVLSAIETEQAVCRVITDQIKRNSVRFNSELVTNNNPRIVFATADSHIMSSRMQSQLNSLADSYFTTTGKKMNILKAWTTFPDNQLNGVQALTSLHFEGRSVRVRLPAGSNYDQFLEMAVIEAFDWVHYARPTFVRLSVIPSNCRRNIDGVFMLDRSGSVGAKNHQIALEFIEAVATFFTIGRNMSQFGVVAYSYSASIQFDLDDHNTFSRFQNAVNNVVFTGGATNTPDALDKARLLLNPANNRGARLSSVGIPKIAILITDGRSNRGNLNQAAMDIQNAGIQVYAVGIGNIALNELNTVASDPDNTHVFILQSYLDAAGFVDFLSVVTCDAPAIIEPGDNTTTEIPDGGTTYFQTSCVIFSDSVLVELIDVSGTTFLFASATQTNPGPLTIDTVTNTTTGITRKTVTLTLPRDSKVVYIGCQGQTMLDRFTIIVWDRLFDPVDAYIDLVEGFLRGVTIYEVQRNLTSAASANTYTYSIIEGNEDRIFSINPSSGRVFISTFGSPGINFDKQRTHNLTVQAQNNMQSCQRARIRINIRVISNRITFNSIPPVQVPETAVIRTFVVQVVASGGAGNIVYSITRGNSGGDFDIDSNTGIIRVNQMLNFETVSMYTLVVRALSTGTTVTGDLSVPIGIQDVNEVPFFISCTMSTSGCNFNIAENEPVTHLGRIMANDPDLNSLPNGMLTYNMNSGGLPFSVDFSGNLRTTAQLDREDRSLYLFSVIVRDGCLGCALSFRISVMVTVNDLNDNSPVFTHAPSMVQVSEDSRQHIVVAEYRAVDADTGANAVITFTLSPTNLPFTLSPTGTLSLTGGIDFEVTQSYTVTITASNPGNTHSSTATTTIDILNVNDNTPVITGKPYSAAVLENADINFVVETVTAMDADVGIHGQIYYRIISGNFQNYFALNPNSGVLTINGNIDRETIDSINLVVEARDKGTPQTRNDKTTFSISIVDENDNRPIFRPDTYSVQLREDLPVGHNVIQVIATDADKPNSVNSNIRYSFRSGNSNDKFGIRSNGQIQISSTLDFETNSSYALVVEARDEGNPVLSGTARVAITVINVNENPPTLTGDQAVNVSESAPINSAIAIFEAQDQDQMSITISIVSGNIEGKFVIGVMTGEITLVASLDYETTIAYTLVIRASDGQRNTEASLSVTVLDENEFSPVFSGPFDFTIREEEQSGIIVGTVMATDGDRGAVVTYEFVRQDQSTDNFILDRNTGIITTRSVLNRETMTQVFSLPLSRVTVQIFAIDNGTPTMRTPRDYTITLEDINDNAPTFLDASYSNQLLENQPAGQAIFNVASTDPDLGLNSEVSYSFTLTNNQGSSNPFRINSATGAIETVEPLDCELQTFYLFTITAKDRGSPSMSTTVSGNLSLIDMNDNAPQFSQDTYHISVSEDFNPGDVVMPFVANDADKGINAEVEYFIISNVDFLFLEGAPEVTVFLIDRASGVLQTLNLFNFEGVPQVNLSIFANDRGLPQMTGTTTLVIDIMNIDEEPPIFQAMTCDTTVSEDISIGTVVTSCTATDPDTIATGNQSPITFHMTSQFFEVNSTNGDIITKAPLDREINGGITLTITVTDLSGRSASRRVVIRITDVNDTPPQFLGASFSYHFTDNAIQSYVQEFLTLQVVDPDLGSNGTFTLSIGRTFKVTDTETQVEVIAQDDGSPQMTNSINVTVTFQSPCQLQTYSITPDDGLLSARLLCAIEVIPAPSYPVVFGLSGSLSCRIVRNTPTEYQWLQNSSIITNAMIVGESITEVSLPLRDIRFSHAGQYACKASSLAGSLQSLATTAIIQMRPTIISLPQDIAIEKGSKASFTCSAVGIPTPTVEWFVGTQRVGKGSVFTITDVDSSKAGTYTCGVSNIAGSTTASATLVVFDAFSVVQLVLTNIQNPNSEENCQYFDPTELETIIISATNMRVMVTRAAGSNLCDINSCSPSPCKNGARCSLKNVRKGYECTCTQGYMGINCNTDVDECSLQDECGVDGECSNTKGSFLCNCKQNITGSRCQFQDKCSKSPCSGEGELCLEDFTIQGYQCRTPNRTASLTVGGTSVTIGHLNDLIQAFIDMELQTSSTRTSARRRRQATSNRLITQCEPRFSAVDMNEIILLWDCPPSIDEPTAEQQQKLCMYLMGQPIVIAQCKLPLGEVITPPTNSPVPTTSVTVDLVFVDANNKPIDSTDSSKILEDKSVLEELGKNGFTLSVEGAKALKPRPEESNDAANLGGIVGGAVGGLVGLILIIVVVVVIIKGTRKGLDSQKNRQKKKQDKALQMIHLEPGMIGGLNSKSDTISTSASTAILIADSPDYDDLPPRIPPKKDLSVTTSITTKTGEESIYGNVTKTDSSNGEVDKTDLDYDNLPEKD